MKNFVPINILKPFSSRFNTKKLKLWEIWVAEKKVKCLKIFGMKHLKEAKLELLAN